MQLLKMTKYLIPTNDEIIEVVAKAICKNRMWNDADRELKGIYGKGLADIATLEESFELIFENLWNGQSAHDNAQRQQYRADADAAISAINLKLLISE